ncbi:TetR/AcrR family transcriptional regulator [Inquilinus sp. NPDC058860]|uniref:TetR/AcrR family transcriptional regulator n=1 Tax=Inquilinus sp. NPDC058860 TaxID=3346652 RepID=UPI0036B5EAA6
MSISDETTDAPTKDKPKPPATKAVRDPERTSAAILAAAVKEFMEKGYSGARINEIAKRAGANKRMLYHYFGDKEALYLAVLEGAYVAIRSAESKLHLADHDPVEGIRELALFTWRYFIEHPEFLSLLQTENLMKARHLKRSARIFDLHSPLVAVISDLLERGAAKGVFRADADPVKVYVSIASLGAFYLSNRYTLSTIFRRELTETRALAEWGDHIAHMILASLRP